MTYSKHKDKSPQDTIFFIREILNRAGIFTVVHRNDNEYKGAYSNRISIYPSKILGQNGKGSEEIFAQASGYAELLERIQNSALGQRLHAPELNYYAEFFEVPDEKIIAIDELLAQNDSYLENIFKQLNYIFLWDKESFIETLAQKYYGRNDGKINVIPYVDYFGNRIVYLPLALINLFALTNGMTAGNTLEEALVQGISENYERYVERCILKGGVTPPEIPRDYLKNYGLNDLIEQIEKGGRYKVSVRDCSLGKNYPVTATIIIDKNRGTFGVRFGAHPSIAISVERTLTEAFQGNTIESFTSANKFGTRAELDEYHNIFNLMKVGYGFYPAEFLSGNSSWNFEPANWEGWHSENNGEYLKKLISHVKAQGYNLLIRDSSHMGFKSYHVLISEIHNTLNINETMIREFWTKLNVAESLNHFPNLTDEEEQRLLRFIKFKESSLESAMGLLFMHYFIGELFTPKKIAAYLSLKRGDFTTAEKIFRSIALTEKNSDDKIYYNCLADYAKLRSQNFSQNDTQDKIKFLYSADVANRVIDVTVEENKILSKVFPQMKCFECENCALSGKYCEYPAVEEIYRKIKDAMKNSKVSQKNLAEELKRIES